MDYSYHILFLKVLCACSILDFSLQYLWQTALSTGIIVSADVIRFYQKYAANFALCTVDFLSNNQIKYDRVFST